MRNYIFLVGFINKSGTFELERRMVKANSVKEAWFIEMKVAFYRHEENLERIIYLHMADDDVVKCYKDDSEELK
jgi:hypothetical protein